MWTFNFQLMLKLVYKKKLFKDPVHTAQQTRSMSVIKNHSVSFVQVNNRCLF